MSLDLWDAESFLMRLEVWSVPYRTSQMLRTCSATHKVKKFDLQQTPTRKNPDSLLVCLLLVTMAT